MTEEEALLLEGYLLQKLPDLRENYDNIPLLFKLLEKTLFGPKGSSSKGFRGQRILDGPLFFQFY